MNLNRMVLCMLTICFTVTPAFAQSGSPAYPTKPVRLITSPVGGAGDFLARLIGAGISAPLGEQVIVENRPSGVIPGDMVAKAAPDGYTLLVTGNSLWIGPLLQNTPYDTLRDFAPITAAITSPNVLVVHPSLPVKTVKELIALAKARPNSLNFSTSGSGSTNHLAGELLNSMAHINIQRINYAGAGPAMNALLTGDVQVIFMSTGGVTPLAKTGRIRPLAVTSATPSPLAPGLLPIAESGLPGYECVTVNGMLGPAKTPPAIVNRLNQETVRYLTQPEVKQKVFNAGVEVIATSPEQFTAIMKGEVSRMGKVIKDAGIRLD